MEFIWFFSRKLTETPLQYLQSRENDILSCCTTEEIEPVKQRLHNDTAGSHLNHERLTTAYRGLKKSLEPIPAFCPGL